MVIPLIEEIVKSKLSDFYIRGIVEEVIKDELSDAEIREIVQEIAEPLVKEILEQLLS
jgi:predicted secreted protein